MCCLFGMIDLNHRFTARQKSQMMSILATACEARGTDSTGIAYNSHGKLRIYKRPLPAHKMRLRIPEDVQVVMGHTRMATQGTAKFSKNNHPFLGNAGDTPFALAHNGVLHNDTWLRQTERLPATTIETDSYIAVQLIEQKKTLNFDSLKNMAEKVEGSFTFTVLDSENTLYFIKGDNPLCIYFYPETNLFLYASTEEILLRALNFMHLGLEQPQKVDVECGEILCVTRDGTRAKVEFSTDNLLSRWYYRSVWNTPMSRSTRAIRPWRSKTDQEYLRELKSVAQYYGYSPDVIDDLLEDGFTTDDLEEMLYCGVI